MKLRLFSVLLALTLAGGLSAQAGNPKKHQTPAPPQQPLSPDAWPSTVLQPFLDSRLDKILAPLDGEGLKHTDAIVDLRSSISDAMPKAPPARQAAFQAALAICDALAHAYDERLKAIANLQGSGTNVSAASLGVVSKPDHLSAEQLHSEAVARHSAAQTNDFFANAQKSQWTQRAAQWRQSIQQLYLHEREAERQASAPVASAPAAPSDAR